MILDEEMLFSSDMGLLDIKCYCYETRYCMNRYDVINCLVRINPIPSNNSYSDSITLVNLLLRVDRGVWARHIPHNIFKKTELLVLRIILSEAGES